MTHHQYHEGANNFDPSQFYRVHIWCPYKRWIHQCDLFNGPLINPSASVWWTPSFSDDRASIQIELLFLLFLYQQAFTKHQCFIEPKDWTGFFGTYKVWGSDISPFIQMVIKDSECLATTQLCLLSNPKLLTCHHFTDWGCFQRPVRVLGSNESLVGGCLPLKYKGGTG